MTAANRPDETFEPKSPIDFNSPRLRYKSYYTQPCRVSDNIQAIPLTNSNLTSEVTPLTISNIERPAIFNQYRQLDKN